MDVQWRDAYTLCCLICAATLLHPRAKLLPCQTRNSATDVSSSQLTSPAVSALQDTQGDAHAHSLGAGKRVHPNSLPLDVESRGASLGEGIGREGLRILDMAVLMGGPMLRPALDSAIGQLQSRLQPEVDVQLSSSHQPLSSTERIGMRTGVNGTATRFDHPSDVSASSAVRRVPKRTQEQGLGLGEGLLPPTGKRRKFEVSSPVTASEGSDGQPTSSPTAVPAAVAVERPHLDISSLPAGSLRGPAVPTTRLPALERYGHRTKCHGTEQ